MAKDSESRRTWVKNVAIIFLVILLLLTFFSNTILNHSLPEVSAQYAQYGSLTTAVKVSGTVKANASYNVIYEADQAEAENGTIQSRKVVSVYVKEGDTVAKDAPILELQGGASAQLEAAQNEYDSLKKEYDLGLLQDTVDGLTADKTMLEAQKELTNAKENLAKLQQEYNALLGGVDTTSVIEARIASLEEELEELGDRIATVTQKITDTKAKIASAEGMIEEDIFSTLTVAEKLAIAEDEYAVAEASYNELTRDVERYKERLDAIKESSGDIGEANTLTTEMKALENQLDNLLKQYDRDEEDYIEQLNEYYAQIFELENTKDQTNEDETVDSTTSDDETGDDISKAGASSTASSKDKQIEAIKKQIEELEKSYKRSSEDAWDEIESIRDKIDEIEEKLDIIGMPKVDDVFDYAANYDLTQAQNDYDKASADLAEVTEKYNTAKTKVESLRKQDAAEGNLAEYEILLDTYEDELDVLEAQQKQKNKDLAAANKELTGTSAPKDPETVADQIKEAESAITSLEAQLKITEATQTRTDTNTKLNREEQKKKLDELSAKIEAYKNAPETTSVTAPIAGRIVSVNYVPGDSVTSGNTVASIEIADKGYVCEITMPSDEARKIQIGSPCSIVNMWWYSSNIEASVTQIRSDPSSQGKNRIVVIEVKGEVSENQNLTFSIGDKSQSYDNVLPNSAIREDNDGKFVLVVESKKTPLNVRYTAKRVDIEVIASDDTQSAVSGLYGSEFVITSSQSPISDRQQVRLAEN